LYYLKLYNNQKLKEKFFTYYFTPIKVKELNKKGDEFSEKIMPSLCRESALGILKWHKKNNHDILILTASSGIWLEQWCKKNSYTLIGTNFEINNDSYTGKIEGANCFGMTKKTILTEIFKKNNYTRSYGYGDSSSDKYFLELVDMPYLMPLTKENINTHWNK